MCLPQRQSDADPHVDDSSWPGNVESIDGVTHAMVPAHLRVDPVSFRYAMTGPSEVTLAPRLTPS